MGYKIKRRNIGREIKGDLFSRTKKAFGLTQEEKDRIRKVKRKVVSKIPTKKRLKKLGSDVDFRRFFN